MVGAWSGNDGRGVSGQACRLRQSVKEAATKCAAEVSYIALHLCFSCRQNNRGLQLGMHAAGRQ